jgi:hypothetical protein
MVEMPPILLKKLMQTIKKTRPRVCRVVSERRGLSKGIPRPLGRGSS